MKNKYNANPLLHALLPIFVTIAYVLIGTFCGRRGWGYGWILFLLIPIAETLINAIKFRDPSKFAYPVLVTAIFLILGFAFSWWHPAWVLFVTIPAYYAICDAVKKSKAPQPPQYQPSPDGAPYYQPPQDGAPNYQSTGEVAYQQPPQGQPPQYYQPTAYQEQKNNTTAIVITVIVSVAAIIIVGMCLAFSWLTGSVFDFVGNDDEKSASAIEGNCQFSADEIDSIEVNWVNGDVDINYYDGDKITVTEKGKSNNKMTCDIDDGELVIDEFANSQNFGNMSTKDLTVQLPRGFSLKDLEINSVSSNIEIKDIDADSVEFETVSGNIDITFCAQPGCIDCESVSGDVRIILPKDTTGYSIRDNSVSGNVNCDSKNFGDGSTRINLESVSGNYTVDIAE